jgi:polyketide cyclase/dehydrase/lipid transport protein
MPKVETDVETSLPPERVKEALTDFSERRPEIWPGIEPSLYEVYSVGQTTADIKEGTKMPGATVWAKEHYDWSEPNTIRWTVQKSNFCTPGSYVLATLSPREGGGTRIHIEWNRTPTSFTGRLATWLITMTKGRPIAASIQKAMRKLEQAPQPGG